MEGKLGTETPRSKFFIFYEFKIIVYVNAAAPFSAAVRMGLYGAGML